MMELFYVVFFAMLTARLAEVAIFAAIKTIRDHYFYYQKLRRDKRMQAMDKRVSL